MYSPSTKVTKNEGSNPCDSEYWYELKKNTSILFWHRSGVFGPEAVFWMAMAI